jgi:DNA polymerase-3 subunit epsilon
VDRTELSAPGFPLDGPLAFVDVETTGGNSALHRVIEVAVVGSRADELQFEWRSFVNPGVRLSPGIRALTGIDDDMLADAPGFEQVADELRQRLAGRVFVAHNARFDYGFIRREFSRAGHDWRSPSLCTVRLSRRLYPEMERHNLDAVIEYHGLDVPARHRALPDAQALWKFWRELRAAWPREELQGALDALMRQEAVPPGVRADLVDDLPEEPGVYRLFGVDEAGGDSLLYVGKANNLRERVFDHFRGGDAKSLRLAAQTRKVTWTVTAGELGALLLEAREVRERQPVYNKQLRGAGPRHAWLFERDAPPRLIALDAQALCSGNAYGSWRSERDARRALTGLARENHWCLKILGLEAGEGSCFGLQVGRCSGVCIGREPVALHLAKVRVGLARQQLPPWPHAGPVVIEEGRGERRQYHLVDAWQHLATFDGDEAEEGLSNYSRLRRHPRAFDADVFHILKRALRTRRVMPLPRPPEDDWS